MKTMQLLQPTTKILPQVITTSTWENASSKKSQPEVSRFPPKALQRKERVEGGFIFLMASPGRSGRLGAIVWRHHNLLQFMTKNNGLPWHSVEFGLIGVREKVKGTSEYYSQYIVDWAHKTAKASWGFYATPNFAKTSTLTLGAVDWTVADFWVFGKTESSVTKTDLNGWLLDAKVLQVMGYSGLSDTIYRNPDKINRTYQPVALEEWRQRADARDEGSNVSTLRNQDLISDQPDQPDQPPEYSTIDSQVHTISSPENHDQQPETPNAPEKGLNPKKNKLNIPRGVLPATSRIVKGSGTWSPVPSQVQWAYQISESENGNIYPKPSYFRVWEFAYPESKKITVGGSRVVGEFSLLGQCKTELANLDFEKWLSEADILRVTGFNTDKEEVYIWEQQDRSANFNYLHPNTSVTEWWAAEED
ncbi:hypothetical protein QBC38DRAFT_547939 [Podospora fimiseda]|uniref:Uncharacterized protein n=1 Tax=Podospora fimiseda TaxID=252190 RepID=A0AAN7BIK4_9PEZI|nr:hypothetical protein QBC38DRAFT_547939 [Podospora fimiseda]